MGASLAIEASCCCWGKIAAPSCPLPISRSGILCRDIRLPIAASMSLACASKHPKIGELFEKKLDSILPVADTHNVRTAYGLLATIAADRLRQGWEISCRALQATVSCCASQQISILRHSVVQLYYQRMNERSQV